MGYPLERDAFNSNFGDGAEAKFETFGINLTNHSYNASMTMDQDSSCIQIARIMRSQDIDGLQQERKYKNQ